MPFGPGDDGGAWATSCASSSKVRGLLKAAVAAFLQDDGAGPEAVFLDIAAAFPSAEWEDIRWALLTQGVPALLVEALFALFGPMQVELYLNGRATARRLSAIR